MQNKNQTQNVKVSDKPIKTFRAGTVASSVWSNESLNQKGEIVEFRSVTLQKSYKDANDEWKQTSNLNLQDVPKAIACLQKAFEFIAFKEDISDEE